MNRLADESSPYLRQHAENPVDWYPWGVEALNLAVESNKPILLSIGYSACHWCHVMAHESFEDPAIAAKMNASFVNIKVDREERPDVDALYMSAVQAMTGRGGWPMTVAMTPDGKPFFAGTYFPNVARGSMTTFPELLDRLTDAWLNRREEVMEVAGQVTRSLQSSAQPLIPDAPQAPNLLADAANALARIHDPNNGGFGTAPKFPSPLNLDVLLRHHIASGDPEALTTATKTLDHMAAGGIYDHLAGGFARYSVDAHWAVPHFEKMLYDNALLVPTYLHSWQLTGSADHRQVVTETIGWVLDSLVLPGGGLASSVDADSEGSEGTFYIWDEDELAAFLNRDELALARTWYGVRWDGNFERSNVLYRPVVGDLKRSQPVERLRRKLLAMREERVHPAVDDKVLTEWNCLMVSALAEAGAVMNEPRWIQAAAQVMEFLLENLVDQAGRLYRSWHVTGGRRHFGYAADYAAAVDALTRLGEATGEAAWHVRALEIGEAMLQLFWDDDGGGLFTSGADAERLVVRRKEFVDSPTASANGNAAFGLVRLGSLHGRTDLLEKATAILEMVGSTISQYPTAYARLLAAADMIDRGMGEVVITGDRPDLLAEVRRHYLPNTVLAFGQRFPSPLWAGREGDQAYVCRDYTCELPAGDPKDLSELLAALG